jgi:capsular polysaccharide biosynthesis protein
MNRTHQARLIEAYFRHRWLNLLPLLLMIVAAATWLVVTKPLYTAYGTMYVQRGTLLATLSADQSQTGWAAPSETTANEIRSLLQTDAFVRSVIQQSDLEAEMSNGPRAVNRLLSKVRSSVWVQNMGQNIVQFGSAYTSPTTAQQLSAGVMQTYIQWRTNADSRDAASAQAYFEKLIPSYQADLNTARQDLQTYLGEHPDPVRGERPTRESLEIDRLQAAVQDASARLNDAVTKAQNAQLASNRAAFNAQESYSVVDAPVVPVESATSLRKVLLSVLVFVLAGLLLSVVAVTGAAVFDTAVRFPGDVQQKLGLPVLGAVPNVVPDEAEAKQPERAQADLPLAAPQGA